MTDSLDELRSYLALDEDDRRRLLALHPVLAPHFEAIADEISALRRAVRRQIAVAYTGDEARAVDDAVDKLLDLELAVMLRHDPSDTADRIRGAEQQRRIEQVEAMRTLCAGLAHEVRNPVNSAKLQLALAVRRLRKGTDELRIAEPLERVEQEIDRLTTLLDEFLAFARPPALDAYLHDVVGVVRGVVAECQGLARENGVVLTLDEASAPIHAEVDVTKLRQIVTSLVCNAVEAAGGQGGVAVEHAEGHVRIRVTDDGPGIPADVLPRIYEPFFTTKEGGTGMGMSVAQSLVALHDGTIDVRSSAAGTVVEVAIPKRRRS